MLLHLATTRVIVSARIAGAHSGCEDLYLYAQAYVNGGNTYTIAYQCPVQSETIRSVSLKYHMWGSGMGTMRITADGVTVFERTGDQGDEWHQMATQTVEQASQLLITVVIGEDPVGAANGWPPPLSEVALDDIVVECRSESA